MARTVKNAVPVFIASLFIEKIPPKYIRFLVELVRILMSPKQAFGNTKTQTVHSMAGNFFPNTRVAYMDLAAKFETCPDPVNRIC